MSNNDRQRRLDLYHQACAVAYRVVQAVALIGLAALVAYSAHRLDF